MITATIVLVETFSFCQLLKQITVSNKQMRALEDAKANNQIVFQETTKGGTRFNYVIQDIHIKKQL